MLLKKLDQLLKLVVMVLMTAIVVDVTWQVLSRFVVGQPSSVTEEIARFLLIWIGLLGAALAYRHHAHLGLDILVTKLSHQGRVVAEVIGQVVCFIFAAWVMVYGGFELVKLQLELGQTSAALEWKMGYVYSVIPLSGVLICIYALDNIRTARTRTEIFGHSASID